MDDLAAFIEARLDEDEATALAASAMSPPPWNAADHDADNWSVTDAAGQPVIYNEGTPSLAEAAHIARHDPARVLREVTAKRAILARYGEYPGTNIGEHLQWSQEQQGLYRALCAIAAVWSDHPDYRAEWAPAL